MQLDASLLVVGIQVVGVGLEQLAEDVAVALGYVVEYRRERVVALDERLVFGFESVGGVAQLMLAGRVRHQRYECVVEYGQRYPYQCSYGHAYRALSGSAAAYVVLLYHISTILLFFR